MLRGLIILALALLLPLRSAGAGAGSHANHTPSTRLVDAEVRRLMQEQDVVGLALAVIDEGRIVHVGAYGWRNREKQLPLTPHTVMYGASLTKAAFGYMIMQLVDEGRINLDTPIERYLSKPLTDFEDYADLKGDERWRQLTPRMVLNHTTGFANFRWLEEDKRLRFHWNPGERYGYSAEGFYILQMALEEGLKMDVGAEMQRRIFDRFLMKNTSMTWRSDFAANLADGYGIDGKFEPHDERSSVSAAGSMDTSIADQARLWAGIVRGEGLSEKSRAEFVRSQAPILSATQFPTLSDRRDPRGPAIGLAAGTGLVTFSDADGPSWFKGGHNGWTGNMVICQETRKRCVVMLANSVRAEKIYPALARFILGESRMPWWWEYGEP
jgi:CubicO group peptidase (beta-lactamase class C family)